MSAPRESEAPLSLPLDVPLQDHLAPHGRCFGCGTQNVQGLRLKSYLKAQPLPGASAELVAGFTPQPHHEAFEGIVNGGIIGALLDCHGAWATMATLMTATGRKELPIVVTADFHIRLKYPTPSNTMLHLIARCTEIKTDRCTVYAELAAGGRVTATCEGSFVAVKPGHPARSRLSSQA